MRQRNGPAHRARARAVALLRSAARHVRCPATSSPRTGRMAASAPSTCKSTGSGARSRRIPPTPSTSRPCVAKATFCIPNERRNPRLQVPARKGARSLWAIRDLGPWMDAEGTLRPGAHHHHRADGPAPVGPHLRVSRASLGNGDAASLHRHGAEHRHAHRHLQFVPPGQELSDAASSSPTTTLG